MVLIPATLDLVTAEQRSPAHLAATLGADVPETWPPPLNDEHSSQWLLNFLTDDPDAAGWALWYFLLVGPDGTLAAVGNGVFKGRPTPDGDVEIGYSMLAAHQRRGLATEAVTALIDWALQHDEVSRIVAHTLPELAASIRVLDKCGFRFAGNGPEEGTIRYERPRALR